MMGYGGGDLLLIGAVWPTVGSLPRPVCAGCGQWPVWPAAPVRDESALVLHRRPSAYATMRYTNRQPLPFLHLKGVSPSPSDYGVWGAPPAGSKNEFWSI